MDRSDTVEGPLLDLTTLNGKHDVEIAHLLNDLASHPTERVVAPIALGVLGVLGEMLRRKKLASDEAIRQATRFAEAVSSGEFGTALGLEDAYYLAEDGSYGTIDEVERVVDLLALEALGIVQIVSRLGGRCG